MAEGAAKSRGAKKAEHAFCRGGIYPEEEPVGRRQININKDAFVAKSELVHNHTCVEDTMLRTGTN